MPAAVSRRKRSLTQVAAEADEETVRSPMRSSRPARKAKVVASAKLDKSHIVAADSSDSSDSGAGAVTPKKKTKRASTAKPRSAAGGASGRKSKTPKKIQLDVDGDAPELYIAMMSNESQGALAEWTERYEEEQYAATAEMISVFVRASGCSEPVTEPMLADIEEACNTLVENFGEESDGYPLANKVTKEAKAFQELLDAFVGEMFEVCQANILQDNYFLSTLISWLTTLGSSMVRALRHTATYAALKIGRALVDSKNDLTQQIDVTSRHQAAEKKKAGKKVSQKSSALDTQMADFMQRMQDFEEGLDSIFEGVVMHRYRDVAAPIRQLALESLGQWVCAMPGSFLDDSYLKYLGWSLSDKDAAVRNTALCALIDIYRTENAADSLSLFTQRFKTRLIALTEDISDTVGISAMKMMGLLASMDGLEPEEMDMLLEFMFCETAGFSQNAGELFVKAVVENEIDMLIEDATTNGAEVSRPHVVLVQLCRKIVSMSKIVKDNVKVMYTIDALYDLVPELSNWEAYDELLNQDNRVQDAAAADLEVTDTTMTVDEELFLFNLLHAALQRATGTLQIPGHRTVNMGSNQKKLADENATSITEFFMAKLPEMFAKFGAEPEKARLIVEIPQLFDLSLYETKRMSKQFTATLKAISATVMKSSDATLLESCMATLQHFSDPELALHAKTEQTVAELLDVLGDRLSKVLAGGVPENPDNEEDNAETEQSQLSPDAFQMVATLARLNAFALEFDVSARVDDLMTETAKIITASIEGDVNEKAISSALQLYTVLLVVHFGEADVDPENIDEDAVAKIDTIVELRNEFQVSCTTLLESGTEVVQSAACKSLVDLCMIFTAQFAAATTDYGRLAFELDDDVQEKIFTLLATMIDGIGAADKGKNKREKEGQSGRATQRRRMETNSDSDEDETEDMTEKIDRMTLTEQQVQEDEAAVLTEQEIMELLSAFCHAVACGTIDSSFVGQLFPVYSKSQAISEIIRYTLSELRKVDAKSCYEAILYGIESMFLAAMADNNPDLTEVKEVAHRIALTYGFSNAKDETRRSIISIHRHGIEFALNCENTIGGKNGPPENIAFLEVLKEFSIKLHPQDKTGKSGVIERLETEMRGKNLRALVTMEEWNPYFVFLNNLSKKKGSKSTGKASAAKSTASKKKAVSKRKAKRGSGGGTRKRLSLTDHNADEDNFWGNLPPKKTAQASDDESEIEDFASSHEGSARSSPVKSTRRSNPPKRGRSRANNPADDDDDGDEEDSPGAGAPRRSTSSRAGRTRALVAPVPEKLYSSSEIDEEESDGDELLDM